MDSEDSQQSSGHPDSPVDATAREDNPEAMDRSGSDSRSSSDSGSDGEADTKAGNHEEDDKSVADQDENSNVSDRNSNTNADENESRHSGGGSDDDREGTENEDGSRARRRRSKTQENGDAVDAAVELSHEDLSDVSDLDSSNSGDEQRERKNGTKKTNRSSLQSNGTANDEDPNSADGDGDTMTNNTDSAADAAGQKSPIVAPPVCDLRQKLNAKKKGESPTKGNTISIDDDLKKTDEDELDFEAEDGECNDEPDEAKLPTEGKPQKKADDDDELEDGEELEEGEVTDGDEKRPEETEPRPICRFYTRGQCTWGMSCRFLHPGVTDKGNYTMFDMVRGNGGGAREPPMPDYRVDRIPPVHLPPSIVPLHHHPAYGLPPLARIPPPVALAASDPATESPWERGLRNAKEMLRKANKRKEQDIDFEEKKMHLTLTPEELEKDGGYYGTTGAAQERISPDRSPPPAFGGRERYERRMVPPSVYDEDPYGRTAQRYRELPAHRMPHYEDERRVRPTREVIVQRAEVGGRGDEWNDPWMRSKSPGARGGEKKGGGRPRSYSSSYSSSSSSSRSDSSSESSDDSRSSAHRKRAAARKEAPKRARVPPPHHSRPKENVRSASPRRRLSPPVRRPSADRRAPPPPEKRAASPISFSIEKRANPLATNALKRKKASSPPPAEPRRATTVNKAPSSRSRPEKRSSSSSDSSDSSGSDSESSGSESSEASTNKRKQGTKRHDKTASEKKNSKASASKSESNSSSSKKTTRREELLKQLRAVEDAIARKRSKLS